MFYLHRSLLHDGKDITGVGETQNRVERAVQRSVPFTFMAQTITVLWYTTNAKPETQIAEGRRTPPVHHQNRPVHDDMLYALRDTLTTHRIVDARGIMLGLSVSIGWTCGMSPSGPVPDPLAERLSLIKAHLDQRAWRLLLGAEAKVLGRGGIKTVAAATLAHPDTVARGVRILVRPGTSLPV